MTIEHGEQIEVADDGLEIERSNFEDTLMGLELDTTSSLLQRKREERLKLEDVDLRQGSAMAWIEDAHARMEERGRRSPTVWSWQRNPCIVLCEM